MRVATAEASDGLGHISNDGTPLPVDRQGDNGALVVGEGSIFLFYLSPSHLQGFQKISEKTL